MELRIDQEFEKLIRPLSDDEKTGLRRKLIAEGCWQPFAVWTFEEGDGVPTILDGHNRYHWCLEQHATFTLYEVPGIHTRDDAKLWIIENQLHRRNTLPAEAISLAELAMDIRRQQAKEHMQATQFGSTSALLTLVKPIDVTQDIADKAGVSKAQVTKKKFIDRWGTQEEKDALRRGDTTINGVHTAIVTRHQMEVWSRTNAGETQRDIAQILGMHQSQISKLFQRARELYGETLAEEPEDPPVEPDEPEPEIEDTPDETTTDDEPESLPLPLNSDNHAEPMTALVTITAEPISEDESLLDPEPPYQEFIYQETNLEGYKRWLDVFAKHIALIGGLEDVGGMTTILKPLSLEKRETIVQEMLSIRDHWNKHIDDAISMMSNELLPVGRTVLNGQ